MKWTGQLSVREPGGMGAPGHTRCKDSADISLQWRYIELETTKQIIDILYSSVLNTWLAT